MSFHPRRAAYTLVILSALTLAACQGNLGSGGGLSLPQAPGYGAPGAPGAAGAPGSGTQSRQRVLEGAVTLTPDMKEIPLPALGGFALVIELDRPTPSAQTTGPSSPPVISARSNRTHRGGAVAVAAASSGPVASSSPSPVASSSPVPSGSPSPASPAPHASGKPASPKLGTKTIVYPDDAPPAPSPEPSANVQTFAKRVPLMRGYVLPATDLTLYGLAALRFTIPKEEQTPQRGFTIAIFQVGKKHHDTLLAVDSQAALTGDVVASSLSSDAIALKGNAGYSLMLYADELPATPGPAGAGYSSPGNNPFVTPAPSGYPGSPGGPSGYPSPPPYGSPTPRF